MDSHDDAGLVATGGTLDPETLISAYSAGIFPWSSDPVISWWSPDPRAIFDLEQFHVPRRLCRTLRSGAFALTVNRAFGDVIRGCGDRAEGTWITAEMIRAYEELHRLGHVHSVEAWRDGRLAGGIYGIAVGGLFSGESMFSRQSDGSKAALVFLVEHLRQRGYTLFDIQMVTPHTAQFRPRLISRREYLRRLRAALALSVTFAN